MATEPKDDMRSAELASEDAIHALFGDDFRALRATAAAIDRVNDLMRPRVAETFFSTNKRRHMEYERVPVGHDTGYRCYDATKHNNAQEAFEAGEYGDGMSENEAYVDWLRNRDDEPPPRMRLVNGGGGVEPPEFERVPCVDPDERHDD